MREAGKKKADTGKKKAAKAAAKSSTKKATSEAAKPVTVKRDKRTDHTSCHTFAGIAYAV